MSFATERLNIAFFRTLGVGVKSLTLSYDIGEDIHSYVYIAVWNKLSMSMSMRGS